MEPRIKMKINPENILRNIEIPKTNWPTEMRMEVSSLSTHTDQQLMLENQVKLLCRVVQLVSQQIDQ
jgi:hypothetical protein